MARDDVQPSDAELLDRWRAGDLAAGETLFARYYPAIERFFLNKLSIGIDDLVHETFRLCLEAKERIADPTKFRPYLFSIARNVLHTFFRKKGRRDAEVDLDEVSVRAFDPGPSSVLVERQEQRLLLEALRSVPVNDQLILELYYWESLKVADICQVLDITVPTAKGRLHRARKRLREKLEELADSPDLLDSTVANLDDWARGCRDMLDRVDVMSP
ncbi:RNA polymerase sigma factor [Haliangium sp.]|uniref:RNA polymerase sigma factor n=1 Tax=Haliangium sp. TaxID=2663208 RepID=UPI003D1148D7